jgi:glycerol-3-phosphate acyltransferase PlsY
MPPTGDWGNLVAFGLLGLVIGYLLGSIPFGLILTKLSGGGDVRQIGSGNIGATNVLRTGSKPLAALTLVLDVLKGTVAVLLGALLSPHAAIFAGLGAFLGHLFPVWIGFKGGKGVATYLGVALGLYWPAGLTFCVVWLLVAINTRYSSLAALIGSAATVGALAITGQWPLAALFLLLTVLLYIRHISNIGRLVNGEETRIGESKQGR